MVTGSRPGDCCPEQAHLTMLQNVVKLLAPSGPGARVHANAQHHSNGYLPLLKEQSIAEFQPCSVTRCIRKRRTIQ